MSDFTPRWQLFTQWRDENLTLRRLRRNEDLANASDCEDARMMIMLKKNTAEINAFWLMCFKKATNIGQEVTRLEKWHGSRAKKWPNQKKKRVGEGQIISFNLMREGRKKQNKNNNVEGQAYFCRRLCLNHHWEAAGGAQPGPGRELL